MQPAFNFRPHTQKQSNLIHSTFDLTIAATGTQWGKSKGASLWFLKQLLTYTEPDDNFIVMAPSYKILAQSAQPYLLSVLNSMNIGEHRKGDALYELKDGRIIYFRTETDPDSIVGIPKVRAYWLDEAGKARLYFHENIQARAASVGARGMYTTSPYARNWIYQNYIKPISRGKKLEGVNLIQAASWENPFHSLADVEKRKQMLAEMDPRRFEMLFGGEWGKQAGLVYDCFDDIENICPPFRLPNGTNFYGGIDWGHTEPFVIVVRAITPDNQHFQVSEFYKMGMTVVEQMNIARQKMATFGIKQFYCGHERPENILLFNQNHIPSIGVPEKDIQVGTDLHYELIKTRKYKIFEGTSPYSLEEYETYHYPEPEELEPDDEGKEQGPVGQGDHCIAEGTLIETARGSLPIEKISELDLVLTSEGYARVALFWDNGIKPTVLVKLSNGSELECTEEHFVFTKNAGFVNASALRLGDVCASFSPCQKRLSLEALSLGATHRALALTCGTTFDAIRLITSRVFDICIAKFGSRLTAQSQLIATYSTETETRSITKYLTLSAFPLGNIARYFGANGMSAREMSRNKESIYPKSGNAGSTGTRRPQAKQRIIKTLLGFAPKIGKKWNGFVSYAEQITNAMKCGLKTVRNGVLKSVGIDLITVVGVKPSGRSVRVYDLTVDGRPEYYANAVLVHNCMSANRFVTLRTYRSNLKLKPSSPEESQPSQGRETQTQKFKRLMTPRAGNKARSENWS